jgi:hypothetical protein
MTREAAMSAAVSDRMGRGAIGQGYRMCARAAQAVKMFPISSASIQETRGAGGRAGGRVWRVGQGAGRCSGALQRSAARPPRDCEHLAQL